MYSTLNYFKMQVFFIIFYKNILRRQTLLYGIYKRKILCYECAKRVILSQNKISIYFVLDL